MIHILRLAILLIVLGVSASASADEFYGTYQSGMAHFHARDYSKARADYLAAYNLRAEPIVLFNIAQTYRLESNVNKALEYYKKFLAESKIAEDLRNEAESYVAKLEEEATAAEAARRRLAETGPREADGTPVRVGDPPMNKQPSTGDGATPPKVP